jgi:diguanylate cyclase (GGDEF)-like protein/PAS domain S-box-containing protein
MGLAMFRIYLCTVDNHQPWLVGLAALICLATTVSGMLLFRQALDGARRNWLLAAGAATGFGIWSTHFVGLLGYLPGYSVDYRLTPTAGSLLLAVVTSTLGFWIACRRRDWIGAALAALITGSGIAGMHYLGVLAMDMPALIHFDTGYAAASIALVMLPLVPAYRLAQIQRGIVAPCALMTLAVIALHFTGMAAIMLVPSARAMTDSILVSPQMMTGMVAIAAATVVATCLGSLGHARRVQTIIRHSERDMAALVEGLSDCAMYMLTREGCVKNWNSSAQRLKGYTPAEVLGRPVEIFHTPGNDAICFAREVLDLAAIHGKHSGEGWCYRKDGTRFWASVTMERVVDARQRIIGFIKITRDLTRARHDEERLAEARRHLDTALDNMHLGLALFDAHQRLVLCNHRLVELWKLAPGALQPGMALDAMVALLPEAIHPANPAQTRVLLHQAMLPTMDEAAALECRPDLIMSVTTRPLAQGGWVTTFEDITERRRNEARIAHLAMHDALTGLPNRARFAEQCAWEMNHTARHGRSFAMLMIDLDGFKEVNDRWGHAEGDRTIIEVARRLDACRNDGELVARMGGDEFAAGKSFDTQTELSDFVERLAACFNAPVASDGHQIRIGGSIGVAVFPGDGYTLEGLMSNADLAMYRAKNGLAESICYYQPGMDETARARRQIAADLRHAIERDEFHLVYQPQHAVQSGEIIGYEALLRWIHPTRGAVAPNEFIPIAEETGTIFAIGEWVLQEAAREAMTWPTPLKVAVNLSPVQLRQAGVVDAITRTLLHTGLPPSRLELEITEGAIISDKARALHLLRQIKALGVTIAMDDFGTGYSSLDTLQSFPFDKIKIDKSFVLRALTSHQATAIVRAVLALGRSLDIPVLAEGVETEEQLALLSREGCSEAQGFYYGHPRRLNPPAQVVAQAR